MPPAHTVLPVNGPGHLLRLIEAALLTILGVGVSVEWLRAWRSRSLVARVVAELGQSPPLGGLRDALASTLNDPALVISYPLPGNRNVDVNGRDVDLEAGLRPGRQLTPIVRDGRPVAVLEHRVDVLEAPETVDEVVRAARLGSSTNGCRRSHALSSRT